MPIYGATKYEGLHPQQCGYLRRKDRRQRRPEMPRALALLFYPRFFAETLVKYWRFAGYAYKILRMQKRVERDSDLLSYRDLAITPVVDAESEALEMFELNESSKAAVEKARRQAQRHRAAHQLAS
jgi:hypothetical protein